MMSQLLTKLKIWWHNFHLWSAIKLYFDEEYQYDRRKRLIQLTLDKINAESDGICTWIVAYRETFYRYVCIRPDEFPDMRCWTIGTSISSWRLNAMLREVKHAKFAQKVWEDWKNR